MKKLLDFTNFLRNLNLTPHQIEIFNGIIISLILILISVIAFYLTRFIVNRLFMAVIARTKNEYDDFFVKNNVLSPISHLIPALILFAGTKFITHDTATQMLIKDFLYIYLIFVSLIILFRFLNSINDIYELYAEKKNLSIHIKQYLQVVKMILILTAIIFILSILLNKKPGALLAGLGAMTAVLMLVFKDSIMSLVASIQISAYDLIKVGDWISIPSRGIDGDVMDISLNTIKIRNFNKTISTIPTYIVVQESLVNWRGMVSTGARRIKRAIFLDAGSIKFCNKEMIEKYKNINLIKNFVTEKQSEIDKWNKENNIPEPVEINGKALTNLEIFRKYVENFLKQNFRVYKKYKKEKFLIDNEMHEYFVINDKNKFIEKNPDALQFLSNLNGKTIILALDKFLLKYNDNYILENGYLYEVKKITETKIVNGVTIKTQKFVKIIEKDGLFADDLTLLVRQLPQTDKGIPVEIYTFSATTEWAEYEEIQAKLFDHIYAILPHFDLKLFQNPSSNDIKYFAGKFKA